MGGWGAIAQIGSQMASSGLQAHLNIEMQKRAHRHQIKMFQRRYRWSMADMRGAGLNPILAYRTTPGAGSPAAGGAGIGGTPGGVGTAFEASARTRREKKRQDTLLKFESDRLESETFKNYSQAHQAGAQAQTTDEIRSYMIANSAYEAQLKRAGIPLAEADAGVFSSSAGQTMRWIKRVKELINPFSGSGGGPRGR